ncbi:MAG TPA: hypothetical protein P5193_03115 [Microthrixaceae bacterium]|nr:hypothetical protein [Microthrixaceae bacterium]
MTLEEGLVALEPLEWELGGRRLKLTERGDEGLDDLAEVENDAEDATGDGEAPGEARLAARPITLYSFVHAPGDYHVSTNPTGLDPSAPNDPAVFSAALDEIRMALGLLPNRAGTRLLRWRRAGEVAKRIAVVPAVGKPLAVPGGQARVAEADPSTELTLRLTAPDPVILSDDLHSHTFAAGETFTVVNAGTFTAILPCAWSLVSAGPVTIENLDFDEYVRFPAGPVTVSRDRESVATGAYCEYYGPGDAWFPRWPLLRPGDNTIRASAACTLYWRDTW